MQRVGGRPESPGCAPLPPRSCAAGRRARATAALREDPGTPGCPAHSPLHGRRRGPVWGTKQRHLPRGPARLSSAGGDRRYIPRTPAAAAAAAAPSTAPSPARGCHHLRGRAQKAGWGVHTYTLSSLCESRLSDVTERARRWWLGVVFAIARIEASQCPDVVVAQIDPKKLRKKQTVNISLSGCQPAPEGYSPTLKWQQQQVVHFSAVRQSLNKHRNHWKSQNLDSNVTMPKSEDEEGWKKFCLGEKAYSETVTVADNENLGIDYIQMGFPPLLSIVSRMNQATVTSVLEYLINWFGEKEFTPELVILIYSVYLHMNLRKLCAIKMIQGEGRTNLIVLAIAIKVI
ncbi:gem-associated protein 2 isoform X1 [Alligator sinensis]|uniref:Gem-associated protein 2 isoform X1 n=1 Tax=Alligator sinensis TaxID=38654 RepID=A0A3Q0GFH1_ALLSI|nr:gem-associated protein 2 isoform X1 [Alligator sinensis]